MIDTDKYEGRSKRTAWRTSWGEPYDELNWLKENDECNEVDVQVLADAPLLLAKVKELQAWKKLVSDIVQQQDGSHLREMLKEMIK